jgi:hypothetical protein
MHQKPDPVDPDIFWVLVGDSTAKISGDSNETMEVDGGSPRIFIEGPWTNVEQTAYVKLGGSITQPGMYVHVGARSNHEIMDQNKNRCGFGRYVAKFDHGRASGPKTACDKEVMHDLHTSEFNTKPFPGFNQNKWLGIRLIVRTITQNNNVKVEAWIDTTGGKKGGTWTKNSEWIDDGTSQFQLEDKQHFIDACMTTDDPDTPLKINGQGPHDPKNLNQRWLKASRHCYWRIQNVDRLMFKWMSVREINPL